MAGTPRMLGIKELDAIFEVRCATPPEESGTFFDQDACLYPLYARTESHACGVCERPVLLDGLARVVSETCRRVGPGRTCEARIVIAATEDDLKLVCAACARQKYFRCHCIGQQGDGSACRLCTVWVDATSFASRFCRACVASKCTGAPLPVYGSKWHEAAPCDYKEPDFLSAAAPPTGDRTAVCDWRVFLAGMRKDAQKNADTPMDTDWV